MKLVCPRCRRGKEIGRQSRYTAFTCDGCGNYFRGIHAEVAQLDFFLKKMFTLNTERCDYTGCPYCGFAVGVFYKPDGPGVDVPDVCGHCGSDLPVKKCGAFTPGQMTEMKSRIQSGEFEAKNLDDFEYEIRPDQKAELENWMACFPGRKPAKSNKSANQKRTNFSADPRNRILSEEEIENELAQASRETQAEIDRILGKYR